MNCQHFTEPDIQQDKPVSAIHNLLESNVPSYRTMRTLTGKDQIEKTKHQLYTICEIVLNAIRTSLY
jgi:hypothetical protein